MCKRNVPSLAAALETLAHHWNVASLRLFSTLYFGRCSSELDELVSFSYSQGTSTCHSATLIDCMIDCISCP